jgi:cold shock CspA family protein
MSATTISSGQPETGTVSMFDPRRGFGFIRPDDADKPDVYVHCSHLRATGLDALERGQVVRFVRHRIGSRWYAGRVRAVQPAKAEA